MNITLGMEIPQLDLANFKHINSDKLDINKYFQQLGDITVQIKDDEIRNDLLHRYISIRRERIPEFSEAYNEFFNTTLGNTFNSEVKKAFTIGEFYTTKEVKDKLKFLYSHEFTPREFFDKAAKISDLKKNGWFRFKYKSFRTPSQVLNGIIITESLIK